MPAVKCIDIKGSVQITISWISGLTNSFFVFKNVHPDFKTSTSRLWLLRLAVATSRSRGVQAGLNSIVKLLLTDRKDVALTSHTSTDARALRPIALAGEGYHLVLVPASCSLLCRHHVIDDEESSESEPSFFVLGVFFGHIAAGSLIWSAISAQSIRDAEPSILQNTSMENEGAPTGPLVGTLTKLSTTLA
ncbi:uncharacterized protein LACBIDRAFT_301368 [Laccaria bicolor S238N-H82]|uniref:Predicted protein n=1 Tax=Laccaria bicolor (strain S238N-H82 / ATCC MYA-4686) TaxID=486041 RepID=B0CNE0_LACBS|nr:uncharacterized protein LACBIDRAFT_301368 [Laccaria bicolor S238N-H82]EDR15912.1 predicted protein [Laccaria bicolor S238N-H82]|eukprot:XP_001874120.1 predicted protein [Laccaria bicolor S238N-H82]